MTPAGRRLDDMLARAVRELTSGKDPMPIQEFKRPIELVALKARLERAKRVHAEVGKAGERIDKVLDAIEEKLTQTKAHAGNLEQYDKELEGIIRDMIGSSNEPDPTEGGDGRPSDSGTDGKA